MGITRRGIAALLALSCVPGRLAWAAAAGPLSLTTGMREPWTMPDRTGFTDRVIAELAIRLGQPIDLSVNLAASRAIQLADDGVDDGLAARVAGLPAKYPNLVVVPEPIFINDFVACSKGLNLGAQVNWADLVPYSVAYIIGWQVFQANLPQVRELTLAKDSAQLMGLLDSGRADVVLHERWQALWHARELGIRLTVHEPPLARVPMYIYLHSRHQALVGRMATVLTQMKADGAYDRITRAAFAGLDPRVAP